MITDTDIRHIINLMPDGYDNCMDEEHAKNLLFDGFGEMDYETQASFLNFVLFKWAKRKLAEELE